MPRGGRFVGRADAMSAVQSVIGRLDRGYGPAAVVVVGSPGIGKSRLLAEAASGVEGRRTLRLVGFEPEQRVPLAAAAQLLQELGRTPATGQRLRQLLSGDPDRLDPLEPLRLFEAACAAVLERAPVLVVLDDLHWADDMSVALCHYLLRAASAEGERVALVCGSRPGPRTASFTQALRTLLSADEDYVEVALGPLDAAAGIMLVRELDPSLSTAEAEQVHRAAGGFPFWIEALASRQAHPDRLGAAVSDQLGQISADAVECLAAMVVAGRPVRSADLAKVLEWPVNRVDHAVSALANDGLAVPAGASVQISHDLVREAAYSQLADRDLHRLHRAVADWLEADAGDDLHLLMETLEHRLTAGSPPTRLALRILRSPQRRLLGPQGWRRLADIADALPADDEDWAAVNVEVAALAGELGERAAALQRWSTLADRLPSAVARARAALDAARFALDLEHSAEAAHLLERARSEAGSDPWVAVEADALEHSRRAWLDHDVAGAATFATAAATAARDALADGSVDELDSRARRSFVEALTAQRDIALLSDDLAELTRLSDERVAATRGLGEDHLIAFADTAPCLWYDDRHVDAVGRLGYVLEQSRAQVLPALTAEVCHALAFSHFHLGQLAEAEAVLDEAQRLEARLPGATRRTVPWVRGGLQHVVTSYTRNWHDGLQALLETISTTSNPHGRMRLRAWAAGLAASFGDAAHHDLIRAQINAGDADGSAADCARCSWEFRLVGAEYLTRVGDVDHARTRFAHWKENHPAPTARAARLRDHVAALLAATTDDPRAMAMLSDVVEQARIRQARLDEIWALVDLGAVHAPTRPEQAADALQQALELAVAVGSPTVRDLVQRRLRSIGVHTRPTTSSTEVRNIESLSQREHEVARLAATGSRNREIAASLYLSPKTVERHLSNIFSKLAVRNRAELVGRYAKHLGESEAHRVPGTQ